MTVRLDFSPGSRKALIKIMGAEKLTRRGLRQAMFKVSDDLKSEASKEILRKPKSGRTYLIRRGASGRVVRHVASAPGETHANFSGKTRRSLSYVMRGTSEIEFGYGLTNVQASDWAEFLEFGTSKMAARPSLANSIRSNERNIEQHFQDALRGAFE